MDDYVCVLDRAIYGTKQAAHAWQAFLREILYGAGFVPLRKDDAVYKSFSPDGGWCFVGTHVDDLFVIANVLGRPLRDKLWKTLSSRVPITDMGTIRWALKTLIEYDLRELISQFPNLNALCKYVISRRCEAQVDLFLYEHGSAIAVRVLAPLYYR